MKSQGYPHLVALSEGINIPLDKPIILIGRHQECDIQIPSRKISRRHCCVALVNDHLVIRDLGSTNGIRINGVKVVEGNLQADDELTIGNVCYKLQWSSESDATFRAPEKNGIKAGKPPLPPRPSHDDSRDEPMPIADGEQSYPALPSEPAPRPMAMELPDSGHVNLAPLDPPSKPM